MRKEEKRKWKWRRRGFCCCRLHAADDRATLGDRGHDAHDRLLRADSAQPPD